MRLSACLERLNELDDKVEVADLAAILRETLKHLFELEDDHEGIANRLNHHLRQHQERKDP